MNFFEQFGLEQKAGAAFGAVAFILSLLTGIISGVSFFVVIIRSIIMAPVFFIVGSGIILVLKAYVPELYESLSAAQENRIEKDVQPDIRRLDDSGNYDSSDLSGEPQVYQDEEFTELTENDFTRYKTVNDSELEPNLDTSSGKLGKHIVVQEHFNSYEPKIMAQAIRTMMSKDKD